VALGVAPNMVLVPGTSSVRHLEENLAVADIELDGETREPLGEEARPFVEAMANEEDRVVVRCRPYETFAQPPRHLHRNDQEEQITHWVSGTVPWDATDPLASA
jgi:hypothetical protein